MKTLNAKWLIFSDSAHLTQLSYLKKKKKTMAKPRAKMGGLSKVTRKRTWV